jgi:hypothetical protein
MPNGWIRFMVGRSLSTGGRIGRDRRTFMKKTSRRTRPTRDATAIIALAPIVAGARLAKLSRQKPAAASKALTRFGREKSLAFAESMTAMTAATMKAQGELAFRLASAAWMPWTWFGVVTDAATARRTAERITGAGLSPVRRRVVANAGRLARSRTSAR